MKTFTKRIEDLKPGQLGCVIRRYDQKNGKTLCHVTARNNIPYAWVLQVDTDIYEAVNGRIDRMLTAADILEEMKNRGYPVSP